MAPRRSPVNSQDKGHQIGEMLPSTIRACQADAMAPTWSFLIAESAIQSIEKTLDEFINLAPSLDRLHPAVGNRIEARVRPGDLPEHRPDGIRVAAKVDSGDQPLLEALRRVERPERGVKCRDRPAGRARTPGAPPTSICGLPLNSSCARAPLMTPPPGVCRLAMFSRIGL